MARNCYFRAFGKDCDIAIRFSNPNFSNKSNNLAIKRFRFFFHCTDQKFVKFLFPVYSIWWHCTCVTCCALHWQFFRHIFKKSKYSLHFLTDGGSKLYQIL